MALFQDDIKQNLELRYITLGIYSKTEERRNQNKVAGLPTV